ncbi:CD40 ligand isoform X2 [Paramisgurnus dabryanus]|uniref:CD40 ligand isoform X2 n=1 Tax=Paramisgurnus dabryanus TaxID=90735 RepID=UPI003CCFD465
MINTFHTSYNPPPVPPRAGYTRPPLPSNTPLVKFLSVMLLLLMMLTFGGFLYLFQKLNVATSTSPQQAARIAEASHYKRPAAHMYRLKERVPKDGRFPNQQLVWDEEHSLLNAVRSTGDTLIIPHPGLYFIYSHVTFSRSSSSSLKQGIWSKLPNKDNDDVEILKSYCSLNPSKEDLCTASLSGVIRLQEGQQLYVKVTNTSLLNKNSCSFGLFKIQE